MSIVSNSLNYESKSVSSGSYIMSKITPQTEKTKIILDGGGDTIFEIPPKVFNLGRSVLSFQATPEAAGASTFNWYHADGMPWIRQLQLYTREGLYLCDITQFNFYIKTVNRKCNKLSDVMTFDKASGGSGYSNGIQVSKTTGAAGTAGARYDNTAAATPYTEPQYVFSGGSNTATPVVKVQFNLSQVKNTILGMDRDLYFGDSVFLRIVWAPLTEVFYTGSSATDPSAGVGDFAKTVSTLANLTLYTAIEDNPLVVQSLMNKFRDNTLTFDVPYVYSSKTSGLASNDGNINNLTVRYSRAHGKKLKTVIWAPFGTGDNNLKYNRSNLANALIKEWFTMTNNTRNSQYNYKGTDDGADWLDSKEYVRGSCVQGSNDFYYNFDHHLRFTDHMSSETDTSNYDDGLPLNTEKKIDIESTVKTGVVHYIFGITLKSLSIRPDGIQIL